MSWLCQAVRAPGSKRRRATERSLLSIASVLPVKRGAFAGGGGCASPTQRVHTTSNSASEQSNATRFIRSPIREFAKSPIA